MHYFIIFVLLLISGCATMNKDECINSDWRLIGYEDGTQGRDASRLGDHRKACAKHGVTPDMNTYNDGRKEGLVVFCQPSKAYSFGLEGREYLGVCPGRLEADFMPAYEAGKEIYDTRISLGNYRNQVRSRNQSLKENHKELAAEEARLVAKGLTEVERMQALTKIKELSKEQQKFESEIRDYEIKIAVLERKLEVKQARNKYH